MSETSVKIIKNEIRCKRAKNCRYKKPPQGMVESMQQSSATPSLHLIFLGVAEDCCMLSTIPCSGFLYLQFLARCHPYILFHF